METIKVILRAQYDGRKCNWRIVKKTYNGSGGWGKFGSAEGYFSKEAAENKIDELVRIYPGMYVKD
jgi:hypothetical protein